MDHIVHAAGNTRAFPQIAQVADLIGKLVEIVGPLVETGHVANQGLAEVAAHADEARPTFGEDLPG